MVAQKLNACKHAYESEFEILASQFGELKNEVDEHRQKWANVQSLVSFQENEIAQRNSNIEENSR